MKKTVLAASLLLCVTASLNVYANDLSAVKESLDKGEVKSATSLFNGLTKQDKLTTEGKVLTGRFLLENEKTEEAYDYFEELTESLPQNVDAHYYLGVSSVIMAQKASIFSKMGYAKDFLASMEKTLELKPNHEGAINYLIGFHLNAPSIAGGDAEQALTYAEKLASFDSIAGAKQIANVYWATEKSQLAYEKIAQAIKANPKSGELYFSRAVAYIKDKKWQQASDDLIQAVAHAKDEANKAQALYQQGKVSAESGLNLELGLDSLQESLAIASESFIPWVHYRMAELYVHQENWQQAKTEVNRIDTSKDEELGKRVKKLKKKLKKQKV